MALLFATGLTSAIFIADLSLPLGVAAGVPYVALILLGWWFERPGWVLLLVVIASVLTMAGYYFSPEGSVPWVVLFNRSVALFAIWVTGGLVVLALQDWMALQRARRTGTMGSAAYGGFKRGQPGARQ